jgi:hypothetical protein
MDIDTIIKEIKAFNLKKSISKKSNKIPKQTINNGI